MSVKSSFKELLVRQIVRSTTYNKLVMSWIIGNMPFNGDAITLDKFKMLVKDEVKDIDLIEQFYKLAVEHCMEVKKPNPDEIKDFCVKLVAMLLCNHQHSEMVPSLIGIGLTLINYRK